MTTLSFSSFAQHTTFTKVDNSVVENYKKCLNYFDEIPAHNIKIKKKKQVIPLTSIPSVWNLFKKKEYWKYSIVISTQTIDKLSSILYDSLSTDAQIGVLAHELSHIHDFHSQRKGYILKVFFNHLSKRKMDEFEYNTDLICIKQGMGQYLLAWSTDVQQKLNIEQWKGKKTFVDDEKRERYMRPETICSYMKSMHEIYQNQISRQCN